MCAAVVEKTQNDSLSAQEQHGNCTQYVMHIQMAFFRGQKQVCEHRYFLNADYHKRLYRCICPRRKKEIRWLPKLTK
jgi:hypothetical protein